MPQNNTIDVPLLRQLLRSGKAGALSAKGVPGGFVLVIRDGLDEQILGAQRGHARVFKRLESVASFLQSIGGSEFHVELAQWSAKSLSI